MRTGHEVGGLARESMLQTAAGSGEPAHRRVDLADLRGEARLVDFGLAPLGEHRRQEPARNTRGGTVGVADVPFSPSPRSRAIGLLAQSLLAQSCHLWGEGLGSTHEVESVLVCRLLAERGL